MIIAWWIELCLAFCKITVKQIMCLWWSICVEVWSFNTFGHSFNFVDRQNIPCGHSFTLSKHLMMSIYCWSYIVTLHLLKRSATKDKEWEECTRGPEKLLFACFSQVYPDQPVVKITEKEWTDRTEIQFFDLILHFWMWGQWDIKRLYFTILFHHKICIFWF